MCCNMEAKIRGFFLQFWVVNASRRPSHLVDELRMGGVLLLDVGDEVLVVRVLVHVVLVLGVVVLVVITRLNLS